MTGCTSSGGVPKKPLGVCKRGYSGGVYQLVKGWSKKDNQLKVSKEREFNFLRRNFNVPVVGVYHSGVYQY